MTELLLAIIAFGVLVIAHYQAKKAGHNFAAAWIGTAAWAAFAYGLAFVLYQFRELVR